MYPRLWVASLGLLLALAIATPAAADTTTIGQIAPAGSSRQCFACTAFQQGTAAASPVYAVPAGNWRRLVAWRIRGGADHKGHAALRIFRPTATLDRYRMVNQAAEETVPVKRASTFRTNISVQRDDLLGLRTGDAPGDVALVYESTPSRTWTAAPGDPQIGETVGAVGTYPLVSANRWLSTSRRRCTGRRRRRRSPSTRRRRRVAEGPASSSAPTRRARTSSASSTTGGASNPATPRGAIATCRAAGTSSRRWRSPGASRIQRRPSTPGESAPDAPPNRIELFKGAALNQRTSRTPAYGPACGTFSCEARASRRSGRS